MCFHDIFVFWLRFRDFCMISVPKSMIFGDSGSPVLGFGGSDRAPGKYFTEELYLHLGGEGMDAAVLTSSESTRPILTKIGRSWQRSADLGNPRPVSTTKLRLNWSIDI